jgi:hypothetical protein
VTQTANSTLTFAKTDFHLGSDYETDEDCEYGSSSLDIILDHDSDDLSLLRKEGVRLVPASTSQTSLSMTAPVFSPLVATETSSLSPLTIPKKRGPPLIHYDPNAIFGGDSDEDTNDYSDDEDDNYKTCLGYDHSAPFFPRPLS